MLSRAVVVRFALTLGGVAAIALGGLDRELLVGVAAPIAIAAGAVGFILEASQTLNEDTPDDASPKSGRAVRFLADLRFQGAVLVILGCAMIDITWLIDPVWLRWIVLGLIPCAGGVLLGIAVAKDAAKEAAEPESVAEGPRL